MEECYLMMEQDNKQMMQTITETVLHDYFFDLSDWLAGERTLKEANTRKNKDGMVALLRADREQLLSEGMTEFEEDYTMTIAALDQMTDADYLAMK